MKFAFSSNAFRRYSLFETIKILAATGYEGIEIMADIPHAYPAHLTEKDIAEILSVLQDTRLEVANINAFMHHAEGDTYHPSWIEKEPALRDKRIEYTLNCLDLAEKLGASTISTEPGGPLQGMSREQGLELFLEGLKKVESRALEKGARVLIEPEPDLLIESSRQFLEIFEQLNPDAFGLNFDIGHFFCVGENPSELIRELKGCIHHFHLEDIAQTREHYHLMPGQGAIDLPHVLRTIDEIGYDGFVTVELYTYEDRAGEAAFDAFRYLWEWQKSVATANFT
jgi:sugar phosphate isomerase/epimerase